MMAFTAAAPSLDSHVSECALRSSPGSSFSPFSSSALSSPFTSSLSLHSCTASIASSALFLTTFALFMSSFNLSNVPVSILSLSEFILSLRSSNDTVSISRFNLDLVFSETASTALISS